MINGKNELLKELGFDAKKITKDFVKARRYIFGNIFLTIILTIINGIYLYSKTNIFLTIIGILILYIPISEIVIQLINYFLSKTVKPKLMPKMDYSKGIPKECSTFVVIPTIIDSKEKVKELAKKLEIYYLANKSENLYFALLGDCTSSNKKEEKEDKEIIKEGLEEIQKLNKKYSKDTFCLPIFHFLYRTRTWNEKEECYLGWERKRGLLCQFNEFLISGKDEFLINTISNSKTEIQNYKIKYVITLDSDTNLILGSAQELIGAISHILNKPILNATKDAVMEGHAIIQPRVGINLEASRKSIFAKIYAGMRRNRFIYKCNI